MQIAGRLLAAGKYPLDELVVSAHDVGPGKITRPEYPEARRVSQSVSAVDGTFSLSLEGIDPKTRVALVVRDRESNEVLYVSKAVVAGQAPDDVSITIKLGSGSDDLEGDDEEREPTAPAREDPERPAVAAPFRVKGQLRGRAPRGATAALRIDDDKRVVDLAAEFVRANGSFVVSLDDRVVAELEGRDVELAVLGPATAQGDQVDVLFRKPGLRVRKGTDLTLGIDLENAPKPRPRPDPTAVEPTAAGLAIAERLGRNRTEIAAFHDEFIVKPNLRISPAGAKQLDERRSTRGKISHGTPEERFVPSKRPLAERVEIPLFVDSTRPHDERATGRYLAQMRAAEEGLSKLAGNDRGGILLQLDLDTLAALPGSKRSGSGAEVDAGAAFELLKRRFPTAAIRHDIDPLTRAVQRIEDCIAAAQDGDES